MSTGRALAYGASGAALGAAAGPIGAVVGGGLGAAYGALTGNANDGPSHPSYGNFAYGNLGSSNQGAIQAIDRYQGASDSANQNAAAYGGLAGQAYGTSYDAQGRAAPQIYGNAADRQAQLAALGGANAAYRGSMALAQPDQGPSLAAAQLQQGGDAAMAQNLAMARSGRTLGSGAAALQQAQFSNTGAQQTLNAQQAQARIQEDWQSRQLQLAALGQAGGLASQAGGLATGVRQGDENISAQNAGLQLQQQGVNNQTSATFGQIGQGQTQGGIAQQQVGLSYDQLAAQTQNQQLQADEAYADLWAGNSISAGNAAQANRNQNEAMVSAAAGQAATMYKASDRDVKQNIQPMGGSAYGPDFTDSAGIRHHGDGVANGGVSNGGTWSPPPQSQPVPVSQMPGYGGGHVANVFGLNSDQLSQQQANQYRQDGSAKSDMGQAQQSQLAATQAGALNSRNGTPLTPYQTIMKNDGYDPYTGMPINQASPASQPSLAPAPPPPAWQPGYGGGNYKASDEHSKARIQSLEDENAQHKSALTDWGAFGRMLGITSPPAANPVNPGAAMRDPNNPSRTISPYASIGAASNAAGSAPVPVRPAPIVATPPTAPTPQAPAPGLLPTTLPPAAATQAAPDTWGYSPPAAYDQGGLDAAYAQQSAPPPNYVASDTHSKTKIAELQAQVSALGGAPAPEPPPASPGHPDHIATPEEYQRLMRMYRAQKPSDQLRPDYAFAQQDAAPAVDLTPAQGYSYEYKDPAAHGQGRFYGPMAQDLEKTPAGASTVKSAPDGTKIVDTSRLALVNTAAVSELQRKQQAQARQLAALGGAPAY